MTLPPDKNSALKALSDVATPGPISLNPHDRLRVRTSMDHPMCEFSNPYHRQFKGGEGKDPEFMVALWNAYRAGELREGDPYDDPLFIAVDNAETARSSMGTFTQREAYVLLRALDFCLNQERDMLDLNPESEWVAVQAKVLALSKNAEPRELPAAAANPLPSASVRTNDDGMREAATSAQQPAGSAPCTCYVLPHEDDCGIFIGITQSGERVMERRSGADRRYFAPSATRENADEEGRCPTCRNPIGGKTYLEEMLLIWSVIEETQSLRRGIGVSYPEGQDPVARLSDKYGLPSKAFIVRTLEVMRRADDGAEKA